MILLEASPSACAMQSRSSKMRANGGGEPQRRPRLRDLVTACKGCTRSHGAGLVCMVCELMARASGPHRNRAPAENSVNSSVGGVFGVPSEHFDLARDSYFRPASRHRVWLCLCGIHARSAGDEHCCRRFPRRPLALGMCDAISAVEIRRIAGQPRSFFGGIPRRAGQWLARDAVFRPGWPL